MGSTKLIHLPDKFYIISPGLQMIRANYDSRKLTGWFVQDDLRNRGWFAQFCGCFALASCYVVFLSN